ncbi:MAG: SURF2 Surfeit locus protein 2 [Eggerthellaceae bacterium]|nr:SURF2 Surfeit locus protein 2 [Eggerthellaceae bacterium]
MAHADGFSHIKVSAGDDDVVIQAGAVPAPEPPAPAASPREEPPAQADSESPEPPAPADPAPARADAYRETSLEDLESSKMSTMQKVVIAVAVVAVIAFIAWYCLMR